MVKKNLFFSCAYCHEMIDYEQLVEESVSKIKVEEINHETGEKSETIYKNNNCNKLSELLLRKCANCNKVSTYVRESKEHRINAYLTKKGKSKEVIK